MNLRPTNIEKGEGGEFSLFKLIGPIIMSLIVDIHMMEFLMWIEWWPQRLIDPRY
jgi:hypothetical protein